MRFTPDQLESMISSVGCQHFGESVLSLFDPDFEIIHCIAFERTGHGQPPSVVVSNGSRPHSTGFDDYDQLARKWMDSDYRKDPVLEYIEERACQRPEVHFFNIPRQPGCIGTRARFVEDYYDRPELGEEATYTVCTDSKLLGMSLFKRRGSKAFTVCQKETLGQLSGLLLKSIDRHARLLSREQKHPLSTPPSVAACGTVAQDPEWAQTRAKKFGHLRAALLMDARHLTVREAEVCAYIVIGYTAFAISLLLGISANTVATHRKRAYAKLGLSSQTELFNVCLKYCT